MAPKVMVSVSVLRGRFGRVRCRGEVVCGEVIFQMAAGYLPVVQVPCELRVS